MVAKDQYFLPLIDERAGALDCVGDLRMGAAGPNVLPRNPAMMQREGRIIFGTPGRRLEEGGQVVIEFACGDMVPRVVPSLHAPRLASAAECESAIRAKHCLEQIVRHNPCLGFVRIVHAAEPTTLNRGQVVDAMSNHKWPNCLHGGSGRFNELSCEILRRARVAPAPEVVEHPGVLAHWLLGALTADPREQPREVLGINAERRGGEDEDAVNRFAVAADLLRQRAVFRPRSMGLVNNEQIASELTSLCVETAMAPSVSLSMFRPRRCCAWFRSRCSAKSATALNMDLQLLAPPTGHHLVRSEDANTLSASCEQECAERCDRCLA